MRGLVKIFLVVVVAAGFAGPGCTPPPEAVEPARGPDGEDSAPASWVIGMSQCNLGEPWRVQMNADIRASAEAYPNLTVVFKDAQNDTLKQVAQLEEFVSQGVDAIIISPKEAAPFQDPIAKAYQAGIPVIILDRAVPGDQFTVFIGADNVKIGRAAGAWIRERLQGRGRVVELQGLMTSIPGQDRHRGFREGIEGSEIEVIFKADMQWLQDKAQQEMESALARFEQIDLVYAHNDPGAYGAYLAARAADRADGMIFAGIDALPQEGRMYVKEGILDVTFEYPTGGREAIETVLALMRGEDVPKHVVLGSRYFTADNVDKGGEVL